MKTNELIKKEWLQILILTVPFVFIALFWNKFPDQIATHWNLKGQVDDYSGKAFGLLVIPVVNILVCGLFFILPKIDPRKKNYKLFEGPYKAFRVVITLFTTVVFFAVALVGLGYKLSVDKLGYYGCILLFLIMGNYLGNIRPNWFIGIRTPWTLENPEVWRKTHRIAGKLWVASSLVMLAVGLVIKGWAFAVVFFTYIVVFVALLPAAYSYFLFRKSTQ